MYISFLFDLFFRLMLDKWWITVVAFRTWMILRNTFIFWTKSNLPKISIFGDEVESIMQNQAIVTQEIDYDNFLSR